MVEQNLIKSKQRVKQHGEVFTPKKIVKLMLDQEELQDNLKNLESTFLEPAAGEGAFLTEILKRKLKVAKRISSSRNEYDENALIALSSLYGIELLQDNVELLVMNMIMTFSNMYTKTAVEEFKARDDTRMKHVIESAKIIIRTNMVQGNALTQLNDRGAPIIFSEWKILPMKHGIKKVKRSLHSFDSIINQSETDSLIAPVNSNNIEFDLLDGLFEDEKEDIDKLEPKIPEYRPVKIIDVYKEELE